MPGAAPYEHRADAAALLEHLAVGPALVVGHSIGALYGLELSLTRRDSRRRLRLALHVGTRWCAVPGRRRRDVRRDPSSREGARGRRSEADSESVGLVHFVARVARIARRARGDARGLLGMALAARQPGGEHRPAGRGPACRARHARAHRRWRLRPRLQSPRRRIAREGDSRRAARAGSRSWAHGKPRGPGRG